MKETLIPVVQGHVVHVQFNTPTQRFDIHGILKECISEFLKIQTETYQVLMCEFINFSTCKVRVKLMVFNATFNNISIVSWQSVLLVEETGVPFDHIRLY